MYVHTGAGAQELGVKGHSRAYSFHFDWTRSLGLFHTFWRRVFMSLSYIIMSLLCCSVFVMAIRWFVADIMWFVMADRWLVMAISWFVRLGR